MEQSDDVPRARGAKTVENQQCHFLIWKVWWFESLRHISPFISLDRLIPYCGLIWALSSLQCQGQPEESTGIFHDSLPCDGTR